MAQKPYELDITLNGRLTPATLKAFSDVESMLKKLNVSTKTFSASMNALYKEAFSGAEKAARATDKLGDSMRHITEVAAGVSLGEFLSHGMEKAIDLIGEATNKLKEFAKSALEVKAERESLQLQQHATLSSMGRLDMAGGLDRMVRSMQGVETMMGYEDLTRTSNLLLNAAPERFASVAAIHKMLGQLSDVSRDPTTFGMATQALTRIMAEGKVDARHIQEMGIDTGYNFRDAMAKALKVTPEQMTEMMKKHQITGQGTIDALLKAFDIITGPGGAAYKHAEAQLSGLKGLWARIMADWGNFEESFGTALEDFIRPIADKILPVLQNADLVHAFDGMEGFMKSLGIFMSTFNFDVEIQKLQAMGGELGNFINKLTGGFDPQKMLNEVYNPSTGNLEYVRNATGDAWREAIFGPIDRMLDKFKEIGERLDAMGQRLAPLLKLIDFLNSIDDLLYGKIYPALQAIFQFIDDKLFGWLKVFGLKSDAGRKGLWIPPDISSHTSDAAREHWNRLQGIYDTPGWQKSVLGIPIELKPQIDDNTRALQDLTNALGGSVGVGTSFGGNYGIHGSMSGLTEYGHVPGDQPGGPTYDWDSWHGIGHIHGVPYNLNSPGPGAIAMHPEYAARMYPGLKPGGTFHSKKTGQDQRWMDTTGGGPENEDRYHPPQTSIHIHINAIDSDSFASTVHKHAEVIASHVHRVLQSDWERSAVV